MIELTRTSILDFEVKRCWREMDKVDGGLCSRSFL